LNTKEISRLVKVLADYPEIRAGKMDQIHKDLDALQSRERAWGLKVANVLRLCLLTGCRVGEALNATWSQLDLAGDIWIKPGATTKQGTEHRAPLSEAAVLLVKDILAAAPKDEDGKPESLYVFPGRSPDVPMGYIKKDWEVIRKVAKIEDVRMHDLRHTYASILVSTGASLPLIGALLGHTQVATTARYAHLFDDPLRKAADEVGYIVTGKKSAEVVKLRKEASAPLT
jgi:integrase